MEQIKEVIEEVPEVVRIGLFDMQVCVPKSYTDEQVEEFAKNETLAHGASLNWKIRREGNKYLAGDPERQQCADHTDKCHIRLEC
jgi:hypothetical protein